MVIGEIIFVSYTESVMSFMLIAEVMRHCKLYEKCICCSRSIHI